LPISNSQSKIKIWTVCGADSMTNFSIKVWEIKKCNPKKDTTNQNPNLLTWHIPQERKDSYISRYIIRLALVSKRGLTVPKHIIHKRSRDLRIHQTTSNAF